MFTGICLIALPYSPSRKICQPLIKRYVDPGMVAWTKFVLTKDRVCNEIIGVCNSPVIRKIPVEEAVAKILADKPDHIKDDDYI